MEVFMFKKNLVSKKKAYDTGGLFELVVALFCPWKEILKIIMWDSVIFSYIKNWVRKKKGGGDWREIVLNLSREGGRI